MRWFEGQIKAWREKLEKKVESTIEMFVVDFTNHLIGRTPVGDPSLWQSPPPPGYLPGTLINSWFTQIGAPYAGTVRSQNTSGEDSIKQAREVAAQALGQTVYITNTAPYANVIEFDSWSSQAPQGMARITAVEFFNTRKLRKVFRSA